MPRTPGLPRARIAIARTVVLKLKTSEFKTLIAATLQVLHLLLATSSRTIAYHCYNLSASDRTSGFAWLASACSNFCDPEDGQRSVGSFYLTTHVSSDHCSHLLRRLMALAWFTA